MALRLDTITTEDAFASMAQGWDGLVRAMPRPSPFMLHGWLLQWWRHHGNGAALTVHVAHRDDNLVAALPLFVRRGLGGRVARFLGGVDSALADLLVAENEDENSDAAIGVANQAAHAGFDFADLFGLPADNRLSRALGPARLQLLERVEAPVLDLVGDWDAVYRAKTTSKRRNQNARARKRLASLGTLEVAVARRSGELEPALEEALRLHALRWEGRPDRSGFTTPTGLQFHRAALRALAALDIPRIVTLKLDGRAVAYHYYFALAGRMYVHNLGFDPAFAEYSPGLLATLEAIKAGATEGLSRVEFLGGAERYKLALADRLEPMHQGIGLAQTPLGRVMAGARTRWIPLYKRLKSSPTLRRVYYESLTPARRAFSRVGDR